MLVTWVQSVGCAQEQKLTSNCSDFIVSKAEVTVTDLASNLYLYFPDLYQFLVRHLNKLTSNEAPDRGLNRGPDNVPIVVDKQNSALDYHSPGLNYQSANDGPHSIT